MRIEFHRDVPDKIREAVVDAVRTKEVTEGLTGMVCDNSDFWIALLREGYKMIVHVYGYEIMPLDLYIQQDMRAYTNHTCPSLSKYKEIMYNALRNNGLSTDDIKRLAPSLKYEEENNDK